MNVRPAALFLVAMLLACGGAQTPVPVVGASADISQLAGEWYGEYSSVESGRSGSIVFKLVARDRQRDGRRLHDAPMAVRQGNAQAQPMPQPTTTPALTIRFVRVAGGQVSGALAPYTDPNCGCTLHTTFVGRLQADTLEGTYTSRHEQTRDTQKGRWRVVRKQP